MLADGYNKGTGLGAEIIGAFVLVYIVFSATDPKRNARDSHVPVLAPLPIGFAMFMVHLATIPITGTSINPVRSLGAAVIFNDKKAWDDQWIFWVGPFIGAATAAIYHQYVLRAQAAKALGSYRVDYCQCWIDQLSALELCIIFQCLSGESYQQASELEGTSKEQTYWWILMAR